MLKLLELESVSEEEDRQQQHKAKTEPAKSVARDIWEKMTNEQKSKLADISTLIIDFLRDGEDQRGFEYYTEQKEKLDVDEQVALWSRLNSEHRSTIKRMGEAFKKSEEARKERH